jgi:hypothetical protein
MAPLIMALHVDVPAVGLSKVTLRDGEFVSRPLHVDVPEVGLAAVTLRACAGAPVVDVPEAGLAAVTLRACAGAPVVDVPEAGLAAVILSEGAGAPVVDVPVGLVSASERLPAPKAIYNICVATALFGDHTEVN